MLNDNELVKISDIMGNAVHHKRMEKRAKEKGWHSPENCPERQNKLCYHCKSAGAFTDTGKVCCCKFGQVDTRKECDLYEFKSCKNCHPCMVPYSELPESEKELDRDYPREFIRALDILGYEIVKKGN